MTHIHTFVDADRSGSPCDECSDVVREPMPATCCVDCGAVRCGVCALLEQVDRLEKERTSILNKVVNMRAATIASNR